MAEPGKPKFGAFAVLAEQVGKKEEKLVSAPSVLAQSSVVEDTSVPAETERERKEQTPKPVVLTKPLIADKPLDPAIQKQVIKMTEELLDRKVREAITGRRSTFKGPRVTRSYKIEPDLDNWLDAVQNRTGIEKSTFVIQAIRAKLEKEYPELKPSFEAV